MVLRVNLGDCLEIRFQNLLSPGPPDSAAFDPIQPITRHASIHAAGMELVGNIGDNGSFAGANGAAGNTVVAPNDRAVYRLFAAAEGARLLYSTGADFDGFNTNQLSMGLFGAVIVEPKGSEWCRSQVSNEVLASATRWAGQGAERHREIDYTKLRMLDRSNQIVASDLTAIITGPNGGLLPATSAPDNPTAPNRREPYREITVLYYESQDVVQAFPWYYESTDGTQNSNFAHLNSSQDSFAINYGIAGIASQILANRMGIGPSKGCKDCKFEEFFLNSWAGGDPAMVVDVPANTPCTVFTQGDGKRPTTVNAQLELLTLAPTTAIHLRRPRVQFLSHRARRRQRLFFRMILRTSTTAT